MRQAGETGGGGEGGRESEAGEGGRARQVGEGGREGGREKGEGGRGREGGREGREGGRERGGQNVDAHVDYPHCPRQQRDSYLDTLKSSDSYLTKKKFGLIYGSDFFMILTQNNTK